MLAELFEAKGPDRAEGTAAAADNRRSNDNTNTNDNNDSNSAAAAVQRPTTTTSITTATAAVVDSTTTTTAGTTAATGDIPDPAASVASETTTKAAVTSSRKRGRPPGSAGDQEEEATEEAKRGRRQAARIESTTAAPDPAQLPFSKESLDREFLSRRRTHQDGLQTGPHMLLRAVLDHALLASAAEMRSRLAGVPGRTTIAVRDLTLPPDTVEGQFGARHCRSQYTLPQPQHHPHGKPPSISSAFPKHFRRGAAHVAIAHFIYYNKNRPPVVSRGTAPAISRPTMPASGAAAAAAAASAHSPVAPAHPLGQAPQSKQPMQQPMPMPQPYHHHHHHHQPRQHPHHHYHQINTSMGTLPHTQQLYSMGGGTAIPHHMYTTMPMSAAAAATGYVGTAPPRFSTSPNPPFHPHTLLMPPAPHAGMERGTVPFKAKDSQNK